MGDQIDYFRALRDANRDERAKRREAAPRVLAQHDVGFRSYNDGVHLYVRSRVDFYPGTERWRDRETGQRGRGVFSLLRHLGVATVAKDVLE